ncbi:ABC transporter substrate-binding protein [Clostridium aestuarii]|uniref:ABC transporter substrate-binding protein n=1 Tax=Clostridium aestuarii TaxID=338193 RepID=A0ABT4D154_9CLOT|nr:ABC transporter substrate-binding protein [Clostridium aestuarii]MCY6484976.1 ABC transporter substrate-binding protein [Clostridium aestuarii]
MKKKCLNFKVVFIVIILSAVYLKLQQPIKVVLLNDFTIETRVHATVTTIPAKIAEEEINKSDGILERKIKLIVEDTNFKNLDETFKKLDLKNDDVIISAANSENLTKLEPYLEKYNIPCIAVNATAVSLSNKKDNIYRLMPDDRIEIDTLFNYLNKNNIGNKVAVIYDDINLNYQKSVEDQIKKIGGQISSKQIVYGKSLNFKIYNKQLINKCDLILILASGRDTALIIQNLRKQDIDKKCFGLSCNVDSNLLSYGGQAIEGFTFISPKDISTSSNIYKNLNYNLEKYGKDTSIITIGAYEAYMLIKKVYCNVHNDTFKKEVDKQKRFIIHNQIIEFNDFGDCVDKEFVFKVKGGSFSKVEDGIDGK